MKKIKYLFTLAIVAILVAFINFGVFVPSANSFEDIEQQRELCLQDCHEQFDYDDPGLWQLSAQCIDRCEKRYWKKWNRQMNNIGND
ncbi:MAG: hypothetical protein M0T73_15110 [Deltaproteobacteria bacterium]|nr:hypothetical protein [Deltaproteobacteria bacterium]